MSMSLPQQALFLVALSLTSIVLDLALANGWGPELTGWSVAGIFGAAFFVSARYFSRRA
jgi:hypothetical protein